MRGLILKDLLNLKKSFKSFAFVIVFYVIFSFTFSDTNFLSGVIILLFTMMSISSFSYDNIAKWDKYALSFPISRKDMVLSKYILSFLLITVGSLVSLILSTLLSIYKNSFSMELLPVIYSVFFVAVIYISILLPLIYKFGVEKSRMLIFIVFIIPTIVVALLSKLGIGLPSQHTIELSLKISPLIMAFIIYISLNLSNKIYCKKEV